MRGGGRGRLRKHREHKQNNKRVLQHCRGEGGQSLEARNGVFESYRDGEEARRVELREGERTQGGTGELHRYGYDATPLGDHKKHGRMRGDV